MLNSLNKDQLSNILSRWYFGPIAEGFDKAAKKNGLVDSLDHLSEVMRNAEEGVGPLMEKRRKAGIIDDMKQSSKAVAGNGYQGLVAYALIKNTEAGNICEDVFVVLKPKHHPLIEEFATVKVDDETLKPDLDLLLYADKKSTPLLINSLKTSLRERAGQTMRWKLVVDVATGTDRALKEKYGLEYAIRRPFVVNLITADFYNEFNNPQQRGTFKFFDNTYISKAISETDSAKRLSRIVKDINKSLCN